MSAPTPPAAPSRPRLQSWIALLLVTAAALYTCWRMIEPFVEVLLWATVLAIISYPYYLRWRARGRGKSAAAGITLIVVVLVVIVPLTLVGLALARQAAPAANATQAGLRELLDPQSRWVRWVGRYVDVSQFRDPDFFADKLKLAAGAVAEQSLGIVGGVIGVVFQIGFVLFALYYLLRDADRIGPAVRAMLPLETEQADEVFRRTNDVIRASLYGIVVIAAIQGAIITIAFALLGIRTALLWGVMTCIASMMPLVGSAIVWVPATVYLFAAGHPAKAIVLVLVGAGIGVMDHLLRPRLIGPRTRLHELVIFFAVLGGLHVFGVLGLVIGPVVVAVTLSLIDVIRRANVEQLKPPMNADKRR